MDVDKHVSFLPIPPGQPIYYSNQTETRSQNQYNHAKMDGKDNHSIEKSLENIT